MKKIAFVLVTISNTIHKSDFSMTWHNKNSIPLNVEGNAEIQQHVTCDHGK